MKILYFAALREKIGVSHEEKQVDALTAKALIKELRSQGENYELAFSDLNEIRVAIDQKLISDLDTPIINAKEIAFFPPMTGG